MSIDPPADPLWTVFQSLPEPTRQYARLRAMATVPLTPPEMITCLTAFTGSGAWMPRDLQQHHKRLQSAGLIVGDQYHPPALRHWILTDAMASPEGPRLVAALRAAVPITGGTYVQYHEMAAVAGKVVQHLLMAIYTDDEAAFNPLMDNYLRLADTRVAAVMKALTLPVLMSPKVVPAAWLAARAPAIGISLLQERFDHAILAVSDPDADPGLPGICAGLLEDAGRPWKMRLQAALVALYGGETGALQRALGSAEDDSSETLCLSAMAAFLSGDPARALEVFRLALKRLRKECGRRKITLGGPAWMFYGLALLHAGDADARRDLETHRQAGLPEDTLGSIGNLAISVLAELQAGNNGPARLITDLWHGRGQDECSDPAGVALMSVAEYYLDAARPRARREVLSQRFIALCNRGLVLPARMVAEVLERVAEAPAPYRQYLAQTAPGCPVRFLALFPHHEPWQRALTALDTLLGGAGEDTGKKKASGATVKRLIWRLDPDSCQLEPAEQSGRAGGSWSAGRAVALKRLNAQDDTDGKLGHLTAQDWQVVRAISVERGWYGREDFGFDTARALPALIGHPHIYHMDRPDMRLDLRAWPVELVVTGEGAGYRLTLSHRADAPSVFLEAETATRYRVVTFDALACRLQELLGVDGLVVPAGAREQVITMVRRESPTLPIRAEFADDEVPADPGDPQPVLQLHPLELGLKLTLGVRPFGPLGPFHLAGHGGRSVLAVVDGERRRVMRDHERERAQAAALVAGCPSLADAEAGGGGEWMFPDPESCLELLVELHACTMPHTIEWPEGKRMLAGPPASANRLSLTVRAKREWFDVKGEIAVDEDAVIDMGEVLERIDQAVGRFIPLADGRYLALNQHFLTQLRRLRAVAEEGRGGTLHLNGLAAMAVDDLIGEAARVDGDSRWQETRTRLAAAGRHQPVLPSTLEAELRDYQLEGFHWLSRLAHWGVGACLADDMGLGKTLQALAVMLELAPQGPCLVVAPTSVCHTWENEMRRFAPSLSPRRLAGTGDRAALISSAGPLDVVVASYGLLHQEAETLAQVRWRMVVLDEAQAIKNAETRRAQAGLRLEADFRLALTGTPIENRLEELWSLFNFVNPGLLGKLETFRRRFVTAIERDRDAAARQALKALVRPFILRRTKSAVLSELPARTELRLEVEADADERAFYEALRRKALERLAELADGPPGQRRIHILAELTRLRRACCHPALIDPTIQLPGAKLTAFLDLVDELIGNRHKALVFSQFVGHLERVRAALDERGIRYQYLDGSTPARDRETRVKAFQAGEGDLFLISLKAGGTGLTLTAADYVIHLDPWWNPAVEDQASDRAHRIGQQRPVTVYRLVMKDTVEEGILALHKDKRDLAADVLEEGEAAGRLSEEDLLALFRGV